VCVCVGQLARHNKELAELMKTSGETADEDAIEHYAKHTAHIEVRFYLLHHYFIYKMAD
jgi:hypothetical protein